MAFMMDKFKGKYRLLTTIDSFTNSFPRDLNGNYSDHDIYISCSNGIQISHYGRGTLEAYIPSLGRGRNIIKAIYSDFIKPIEESEYMEVIEREKDGEITTTNSFNYEALYQDKELNKLIHTIVETDQSRGIAGCLSFPEQGLRIRAEHEGTYNDRISCFKLGGKESSELGRIQYGTTVLPDRIKGLQRILSHLKQSFLLHTRHFCGSFSFKSRCLFSTKNLSLLSLNILACRTSRKYSEEVASRHSKERNSQKQYHNLSHTDTKSIFMQI